MADSASKGFDWINKHTDGRLGGKYVLTEMQKLIMSNNPTWSMQEKRHDLMRREKRDRNRVSLGIKVLDRLKALEAYPMYTTSNFKTLITRVQDAGDGTYVTWPKRLAMVGVAEITFVCYVGGARKCCQLLQWSGWQELAWPGLLCCR